MSRMRPSRIARLLAALFFVSVTGAIAASLVIVRLPFLVCILRTTPGGTLTVTFRLEGSRRGAGERATLDGVAARLTRLNAEAESGTITAEELATRRREAIADL